MEAAAMDTMRFETLHSTLRGDAAALSGREIQASVYQSMQLLILYLRQRQSSSWGSHHFIHAKEKVNGK